ncbi:MAG: hypothetical protein HY698_06855 [Deltaproteobacteria bacterium]|nr:hypothetical protein [Deltaproteobacteria bacterium]
MRRLFLLALLLIFPACGGQAKEASPKTLARLPRDARVAIYESENDVMIAEARRDDAVMAVEELDQETRSVENRFRRSRERLVKSGEGERVSLLGPVTTARRKYLLALYEASRARLSRATVEVRLARARLRKIKQEQLVRYHLAPESSLALLEREITSREEEARRAETREVDLKNEATRLMEEWQLTLDEHARATGDYDTGTWID